MWHVIEVLTRRMQISEISNIFLLVFAIRFDLYRNFTICISQRQTQSTSNWQWPLQIFNMFHPITLIVAKLPLRFFYSCKYKLKKKKKAGFNMEIIDVAEAGLGS